MTFKKARLNSGKNCGKKYSKKLFKSTIQNQYAKRLSTKKFNERRLK